MKFLKLLNLALSATLLCMTFNAQAANLVWNTGNWNQDVWQTGGDTAYLDSDGDQVLNRDDFDDDGDNLSDEYEIAYGLNPLDASDAAADSDNDGLNNYDEYLAGTDPTVRDTDGDGVLDGWDDAPLNENQGRFAFFDINQNGQEDLLHIDSAGVTHIYDAGTKTLTGRPSQPGWFTADTAIAVPDMNGNGTWESLVAGTTPAGAVTFMVFDGKWSNNLHQHTYPGWLTPTKQLDFKVVPDVTSNSFDELVILVEKENGQQAFMVYEGQSRSLIKAQYLPGWFKATQLEYVSDWTGNGSAELLIFGQSSGGTPLVFRYDAKSGASLGNKTFPSWFSPQQMLVGSDINGNGVQDIVALGETPAGAKIWLTADGRSGGVIRTGNFPGWLTPNAFALVKDPSGDSLQDLLVLAKTSGGTDLWRRINVYNGAIQRQQTLPGWFNPSSLETTEDTNANGEPELVIKGAATSGQKVWLINDATVGTNLGRILVN